ncbi:PIN domain-containing protein [Deinococcus frigens]|uniref:PIN domain-containing protein n=1 Tax=Deinococcus frigens TaxID=249403 RepID=UPI00049756B9|nr:PIN domain-containing protein [Deinococcus frigens]
MLALDTNILIVLQKLEPQAVLHYQSALTDDVVTVPAVVRYEARRSLLSLEYSRRLARLDMLLSGHSILDFDREAADIAALLHHQLRGAGSLLDDADLLIAATALRHGATLVTRNTNHFQRIPGLQLADW